MRLGSGDVLGKGVSISLLLLHVCSDAVVEKLFDYSGVFCCVLQCLPQNLRRNLHPKLRLLQLFGEQLDLIKVTLPRLPGAVSLLIILVPLHHATFLSLLLGSNIWANGFFSLKADSVQKQLVLDFEHSELVVVLLKVEIVAQESLVVVVGLVATAVLYVGDVVEVHDAARVFLVRFSPCQTPEQRT